MNQKQAINIAKNYKDHSVLARKAKIMGDWEKVKKHTRKAEMALKAFEANSNSHGFISIDIALLSVQISGSVTSDTYRKQETIF